MTGNAEFDGREHAPRRDIGALLLAIGGLGAAFAAASCCALPLLLGTLGLASGWLFGVAWIAAPHRLLLLVIAMTCLAGGGTMLLWRGRAAACAAAAACGRPAVTAAALVILLLGAVLIGLGLVFA